MSFYHEIQKYNWQEVTKTIYSQTEADVKRALTKGKRDISDFQALISPAGEPFLEDMAQQSRQITQKRFGKTIQMYIPLYLSNLCNNSCVYCGFSHHIAIDRKILTKEEVRKNARQIKKMGFEHILLVTGEDNRACGAGYLQEMISEIKDMFSLISIEVQPLKTAEYKALAEYNLNTVYVYQETYRQENYRQYHTAGKKRNYRYRIETPDRLGEAKIHKIGIGSLLGLEDWRVDSFFTALHLRYLEKKYWKSKYSVSFPRLRPNAGGYKENYATSERNLLQLICAYRLFDEHVELSLSTRERAAFRDNMIPLGVTAFSAGSKTNPGGYTETEKSSEQFSIDDDRSPAEIAAVIADKGYEPVWKDWDSAMQ